MARAATQAIVREASPGDAPGIAHVHVASWRTTYRGVVPDGFLDGMSCEESEHRWRSRFAEAGSGGVFVAESQGEVVGFASGGSRREKSHPEYGGELYAAYLLRGFQGAGIGGRLLGAVAEGLSSAGFHSMLAWVMAENHPARNFYEAAGGKLLGSGAFEIEGKPIEEVAYGWTNLRSLARPEKRA